MAVLPAFNEEALIEETVRAVAAVFRQLVESFEILARRLAELIRLRVRPDREASQRLHLVRRAI